MQQSVSPLPSGWTENVDPGSGNIFYYCQATGETTWTRPAAPITDTTPLLAGWTEHSDPQSGNVFYCNAATGETTWTRPVQTVAAASHPSAVSSTAPPLPAGWTEHQDPGSGNTFYCNAATGETTWTRPAPQPTSIVSSSATSVAPLLAGWTEHSDHGSGKIFFYNATTGETTWTRPCAQTPPESALPEGWTEHSDPSSGKQFFYCAATGETSWTRPAPALEMPQTHEFELEVLRELSQARTNPAIVAECLRKRLQCFNGKEYFPPERGGKTAVQTKEGQVAVRDALTYLERATALPPLGADCPQGLRLAAEDHMMDLGKRGTVGHQGSDGSSSRERMRRYGVWSEKAGECIWYGRLGTSAKQIVEDLIINDGMPERSDRRCIFDRVFRVAGVRMGSHKSQGACCVINLAVSFEENEDKLRARVVQGAPTERSQDSSKKDSKNTYHGQCPGCNQNIVGGSVLEGLGKKWHKDCFVCYADGCKKSLRGSRYQEVGGLPYCKECYYNRTSSTCHGCKTKITGTIFKALGQVWHKECFICFECRKPLGPLDARDSTADSKPLCHDCCNLLPSRRPQSTGATGRRPRANGMELDGNLKAPSGLRDSFGSPPSSRPLSTGPSSSMNDRERRNAATLQTFMGSSDTRRGRVSNLSDTGRW